MMLELNAIVETYGQLEIEVRRCMQRACERFCTGCRTPCCRQVYCRESLEAPFLTAVRERFAPSAEWHAATGWLTPTGCSLPAGRPPVCYEFLCRTILDAQTDGRGREALQNLAKLLTNAGRRAAGRRHLVELTDFSRMNAKRLWQQLAQAKSVLEGLRGLKHPDHFLRSGSEDAGGGAPFTPSL